MRIVVLDDYQQVALEMADWGSVTQRAQVSTVTVPTNEPRILLREAADAQVIVAMRERTPFPREILTRLPSLKLLVTTGMRNAAIDIAAATDLGIEVRGTRTLTRSTVELAWALIMASARQVPAEDQAVRDGGWQHGVGLDLAGATLGILGLGHIGRQVAAIARAFEMRVLAWSANLTPDRAADHGVGYADLDTLLATCDIVSVHLVLSERTRGLLGARELALLGPRSHLVNTSRGPIVDEVALIAALSDGSLGGAALDVFDLEPLPVDHPLRRCPRTILSPHKGYVTERAYQLMYGDAVADISAWLAGRALRIIHASPGSD